MHIYGRASARGKRVQVSAIVVFYNLHKQDSVFVINRYGLYLAFSM